MKMIVILQGFMVGLLTAQPLTKGQVSCKLPATCIDLEKCELYMDLIKSTKLEETNQQRHSQVLKFVRARMCAFDLDEPKVCCEKSVPSYLQLSDKKNSSLENHNEVKECEDRTHKCVDLLQCESVVYLWGVDKPLAMRMIKRQQCGFEGDYPKVCCLNAWNFVVDRRRTTTTSTEMSLSEKSEKMNALFEASGMFDDLAFNLVRRRRKSRRIDEVDIEIR